MNGDSAGSRPVSVGVPDGKCCLIPAAAMCAAWLAYRQGHIRFMDLRVWFAAHEMVERRCVLAKNRLPSYTLAELGRLTASAGGEHLHSFLHRLAAANLLRWSSTEIAFLWCEADPSLAPMLAHVPNHRRKVPVPRRVIRYLATARQPAVVATILGLCLRGLYHRAGACHAGGTCKASWVAETFAVCVRSVRRARQQLEDLGWVTPVAMPHWHQQRFGESFVINLRWQNPGCQPRPALSPRPPSSTTELSPPESHKDLPAELQHTEPGRPVRAGASASPKSDHRPTLKAVTPVDLEDPLRLDVLWRQAVEGQLLRDSPAERLNFFAAAWHARRVGDRNPPGLFAAVVRRRLWSAISLADEDGARLAMRQVTPIAKPRRSAAAQRPGRSAHAGAIGAAVPRTRRVRAAVANT